MIQSVEIENFLGEKVECVLTNPFSHGLNITEITGLGPENIDLVTQDLALIDGSVYSTQRKPERNITISYRFIEAPDIETVRRRTYDLFGLGRRVKLTFKTDHRTLWIEGFVESNEPDIFSDAETSQVSIICPDPWFRSYLTKQSQQLLAGIPGGCGFEFITDYGPEMVDRICFSECMQDDEDDTRYTVFNYGDRDVGFVLRCTCQRETKYSHIYVVNYTLNTSMVLYNTNYNDNVMKPGDMYQINTVPGYKMVSIYRYHDDSRSYTIVPALDEFQYEYSWLTLQKGMNRLGISIMDSGSEHDYYSGTNVNDRFDFTLIHDPLFEGV